MPFQLPNQRCQSTEGKISHSKDLLTPSSSGVFQLCLWPLKAPGYIAGGLPCLSSALWCQYPIYYHHHHHHHHHHHTWLRAICCWVGGGSPRALYALTMSAWGGMLDENTSDAAATAVVGELRAPASGCGWQAGSGPTRRSPAFLSGRQTGQSLRVQFFQCVMICREDAQCGTVCTHTSHTV